MSETSSKVIYKRIDTTDEWMPAKSIRTEPNANRKERLASKAMRRKLEKRLARQGAAK